MLRERQDTDDATSKGIHQQREWKGRIIEKRKGKALFFSLYPPRFPFLLFNFTLFVVDIHGIEPSQSALKTKQPFSGIKSKRFLEQEPH